MNGWKRAGEQTGATGPGPNGTEPPSYRDGVQTKHGYFTEAMLAESGARVNRVTGRIDLPIRWPWFVKPERDSRGRLVKAGIRRIDDAVYAEDAAERWEIANDRERVMPAGPDPWE